MTPELVIRPKDRSPVWLTIDLSDDEAVGYVVVIPAFGPNHRCGMDCWCHPTREPGLVVHNAQN